MTALNTDDAPDERSGSKFKIDVADESFDFAALTFTDPIVTAAQVAEKFGARPASQFKVLQQLANGEIESKRPTETTDLREAGRERFFVIRSDRTFGFTVDELAMEWPLSTIAGAHLRELARAKPDQDLVRVTPSGFETVDDDDIVSFAGGDTDEFRRVDLPQTVTVYYREDAFEIERREWTTEELIQLFGVPAGYKLDLIKLDGLKELKPGKKIKVREGMKFTAHVPAGQSS